VPDRAWEPAGSSGLDIPYSPAAVAGGTVWVSGCISTDEAGEIVADDFVSQARRVYDGMRRALEAAGCSMDDVVSVTTYLTDRGDFDAFNDAFRAFCADVSESVAAAPARSDLRPRVQCARLAGTSRGALVASFRSPCGQRGTDARLIPCNDAFIS